MKTLNALGILERLSKALDVHSDVELAKHLGVATQTISTWKKRDKIPLDHIVEISAKNSFSLDSIIFGHDSNNNTTSPWTKVTHAAQGMADMDLAEDVFLKLDKELCLADQGLNGDTLAKIISAMKNVKKLLPDGLYVADKNAKELNEGVNDYLASYYEFVHLAKKNAAKTTEKSETSGARQSISGENHTIAGRDLTISR